jgi:hypothetical protein
LTLVLFAPKKAPAAAHIEVHPTIGGAMISGRF